MRTQNLQLSALTLGALLVWSGSAANAALITDPTDPRTWQGASVGTFANLYYGADTVANRQAVIDDKLLDDGIFDTTGTTAALLTTFGPGGTLGRSFDTTGTGSLGYGGCGCSVTDAGNTIDNTWLQTNNVIGDYVWDLGGQATTAAIFNTIDHGPLPQEAIESTVYLSNDQTTWTQAVTMRVWLEGYESNLGIKWDGFTYAVGTGTTDTFRYASIIWGGPGALISDGDNEINGVLGLDANFNPNLSAVPIPAGLPLLLTGLTGLLGFRRFGRKA
jgi:hypothetical protein